MKEYYNTESLTKNQRKSIMNYLTLSQKKEIMEDINSDALVLFEYYLSISTRKTAYNDIQVSSALDWTEGKVQRYRLLLQKHGYFHQDILTDSRRKIKSCNTTLGHERWSK